MRLILNQRFLKGATKIHHLGFGRMGAQVMIGIFSKGLGASIVAITLIGVVSACSSVAGPLPASGPVSDAATSGSSEPNDEATQSKKTPELDTPHSGSSGELTEVEVGSLAEDSSVNNRTDEVSRTHSNTQSDTMIVRGRASYEGQGYDSMYVNSQNLESLGLRVDIEVTEFASFFADWRDGRLGNAVSIYDGQRIRLPGSDLDSFMAVLHSKAALRITADIELDSLLHGARDSKSLDEYDGWMEKAGERALKQTIVITLGEIADAYWYNPDVIPEEFQIGYSLPYSNLERRLLTGEY